MDKPKSKISYKRQKFIAIQELFMQMERCSFELLCKRIGTEIKNSRVKYEVELVKKAEKNPKILYKYLKSQQTI